VRGARRRTRRSRTSILRDRRGRRSLRRDRFEQLVGILVDLFEARVGDDVVPLREARTELLGAVTPGELLLLVFGPVLRRDLGRRFAGPVLGRLSVGLRGRQRVIERLVVRDVDPHVPARDALAVVLGFGHRIVRLLAVFLLGVVGGRDGVVRRRVFASGQRQTG